jgi:EAL domain-containing protein (putative c-di-GMP-specific phosphodiesterase class I)/DNA-binding NarL/FixJ family response regulator
VERHGGAGVNGKGSSVAQVDHSVNGGSTVLVVAEDPATRESLAAVLAGAGMETFGAAAAEALAVQAIHRPGVAIVQYVPPERGGIAVADGLKDQDPETQVLLLTEPASLDGAVTLPTRVDGYLVKPLAPPAFVQSVRSAFAHRSLVAENRALLGRLEEAQVAEEAVAPAPAPPVAPPAPAAQAEDHEDARVDERWHGTLAPPRRDAPMAVMLLDLGRSLADGSHRDDAVLSEVGEQLAGARRKSDTVTRLDNGRFAVVCGDVETPEDADRIAGSIVAELSRPVIVGGGEHRLTPSLGVVLAPGGAAPEALFENAGLALRCAQEEGRSWRLFDEAVEESVRLREQIRAAMDKGELGLVYQRVVDLQTHEVIGAEAMVQWRRPGHMKMSVEEFRDEAHRAGLAVPLNRWVIDRVLSELASWRARGSLPERFGLWMTLSPEALADPEFADTVERLTREHGVPPGKLTFEIAERSLEVAAQAVVALMRLSALGVTFVVDDFGTGHANLAWLEDLPIAGLKMAAELVGSLDMADNRRSPALVRGLIALGHELHLDVVGDGVGTQAQAVALRAMGCDLGQGHALGDPGLFDQLWSSVGA